MKRIGYIHAPRIWGDLYLGPGHHLAAPAGIIGAFNTMGNVFFVDIFNGDDDVYDGSLPELEAGTVHGPFATIAHALTQCADNHDDYIIVVDAWNEATPIAVNVTRVHIIGLSANPSRLYPVLQATGNNTAVFTVSGECEMLEIAGLDIGGGVGHGGIENVVGTPMGLFIHHCVFGSNWHGNNPQDGIRIETNVTALRVEACKFLGTSINAQGSLTRDGIRFYGHDNARGGDIVDNIFQGIPGIGIDVIAHGEALVIKRNEFTVPDLANGEAITLAGATCVGIMVHDNLAAYGMLSNAYDYNPYQDLNTNTLNAWARNWKGNAIVEPVGA